jgi:hypothetical protein
MKRLLLFLIPLIFIGGCDEKNEPQLSGEIRLSSQLYGSETYYLNGYNFSLSDYINYSFPFQGSSIPDIINLPFKNTDGTLSAPGFNAPSGVNGFNLLGEFSSQEDARAFYEKYIDAGSVNTFSVDSDTVRTNQVWLQKTQHAHYVKMLVKEIDYYTDGSGTEYVVVSMDFRYQNNGSSIFP